MKKSQLQQLLNQGGATLNSSGDAVNFSKGYQVSKKDCYILPLLHINKILQAVNGLFTSALLVVATITLCYLR